MEQPPTHIDTDRWIDHADAYIRHRGPGQWGIKDPRLTLTWPVWQAAFRRHDDIDLIVIQAWRHPLHVAQSLAHRDNISLRAAHHLTVRYQAELADIRP